MMNMAERALNELKLAGMDPENPNEDSDYNGQVGVAVAQLLDIFQKQGHSGASAMLVANIFYRLVRGEVLSPLKGTPDEWMDQSEASGRPCFQNKRCFSVFAKDNNGKDAYNTLGRLFVAADGSSFSNSRYSSVPISFPVIPVTEYVYEGSPEAKLYEGVFEDSTSDEAADD